MSDSTVKSAMEEYELWTNGKCSVLMDEIQNLHAERSDDGAGGEVIELRVPQWLTPEIVANFDVLYVKPAEDIVCETVAIAA